MDYVVGSVAALVTGNVTPNRPRKFKKALTPTKHQPSPNVTPKSEFVEDRSIFLSPTMQKKKAIVKKSPKRIFQNPDLDVTSEDAGDSSTNGPNAVKVKKHLKDELDGKVACRDEVLISPKSPKLNEKNLDSPPKKKKSKVSENNTMSDVIENMPKKKKNKRNSAIENEDLPTEDINIKEKDEGKENVTANVDTQNTSARKKKKRSKLIANLDVEQPPVESKGAPELNDVSVMQKNKKKKKNKDSNDIPTESVLKIEEINVKSPKKKNKKSTTDIESSDSVEINPNAVTNKDTDSEHESDNEMESENEDINKKALDPGPAEESSDDEEQKPKAEEPKKEETVITEDEVKRTIFVGNVPFSTKCKKEIKKIFNEYGQIETVRIRTVPVKDARVTPKMAVIKNDLHPDRTTVNVYVKFADASSVDKALSANNTVLNDHHLRVSRSDSTGAAHDPKCSIFIGNMPFAIEDEVLRSKFEKCGEIESVRIVRDKKTNAGKGFGYVNFKSKDGVELALALTEEDLTIKNRIMRVKRCIQGTQKKIPNNRQNQWSSQNQRPGQSKWSAQTQRPGHSQRLGQNQRPSQNQRLVQSQRPGQRHRPGQRPGQSHSNYGGQDTSQRNRFENDDNKDGAYRRVMNKRKNQDNNEGPPSKRQNVNQPHKEKKPRSEFVGMTAEKKKKHKFNKGQKKKKVLSEILTKK